MPDNNPPDQSQPAPHSGQTPAPEKQVSAPAHDVAPPSNRLRRIIRPLVVLLLVLVAGFLFWRFFLRKPDVPPNIIQVTGRIEGDDSAIAANTAGRANQIDVRVGDQVKAGQIIAVLDDAQGKARGDAAQSA